MVEDEVEVEYAAEYVVGGGAGVAVTLRDNGFRPPSTPTSTSGTQQRIAET